MANKSDLALIKPHDISYAPRMNDVETELLATSSLLLTGGCPIHMLSFWGFLPTQMTGSREGPVRGAPCDAGRKQRY